MPSDDSTRQMNKERGLCRRKGKWIWLLNPPITRKRIHLMDPLLLALPCLQSLAALSNEAYYFSNVRSRRKRAAANFVWHRSSAFGKNRLAFNEARCQASAFFFYSRKRRQKKFPSPPKIDLFPIRMEIIKMGLKRTFILNKTKPKC